MSTPNPHPASYRDPSGFIFIQDNELYRQVNKTYAADYDLLLSGGLYKALTEKNGLLNMKRSRIRIFPRKPIKY
jgi:hypothetical protein